MDISVILKVVGIGFLVTVACLVLKGSGRDDLSVFVSLAGVIIVLLLLTEELGKLMDTITSIFGI